MNNNKLPSGVMMPHPWALSVASKFGFCGQNSPVARSIRFFVIRPRFRSFGGADHVISLTHLQESVQPFCAINPSASLRTARYWPFKFLWRVKLGMPRIRQEVEEERGQTGREFQVRSVPPLKGGQCRDASKTKLWLLAPLRLGRSRKSSCPSRMNPSTHWRRGSSLTCTWVRSKTSSHTPFPAEVLRLVMNIVVRTHSGFDELALSLCVNHLAFSLRVNRPALPLCVDHFASLRVNHFQLLRLNHLGPLQSCQILGRMFPRLRLRINGETQDGCEETVRRRAPSRRRIDLR